MPRPSRTAYGAAWATFIAIAWFLWRPGTGVVAIFALANVRAYAVRESLFWSPREAALIGVSYGVALGVVAALAAALTVNGTLGRVLLTALGLCGAIYLGYDQGPVDDARVLAQGSAVAAYSVAMAGYLGARALM